MGAESIKSEDHRGNLTFFAAGLGAGVCFLIGFAGAAAAAGFAAGALGTRLGVGLRALLFVFGCEDERFACGLG